MQRQLRFVSWKESATRAFPGSGLPREPPLHFFHRAFGRLNAAAGGGFRTFRIGVSEKYAVRGLPDERLYLGEEAGSGHV